MEMSSFMIYVWALLMNVVVVLLAGMGGFIAERKKLYAFLYAPVAIAVLILFFCGFIPARVMEVNQHGVTTIKERAYVYHTDGRWWLLAPGQDYVYIRECSKDTLALLPKKYSSDPTLYDEEATGLPETEYLHVRKGELMKINRLIQFPFTAPDACRTTCSSVNTTLCWGLAWKGDPFLTPQYKRFGLLLYEPVEYEVDVCSSYL